METSNKKYRLAIVENDDDERFFMRQGFEESGLFDIVGEFRSGDGLLDALHSNTSGLPDAVLTDLNMPGKNGYEILEAMRSNATFGQIPVFVTSTSNLETFRERCLNLGASDYLVKPELFVEYQSYAAALYQKLLSL